MPYLILLPQSTLNKCDGIGSIEKFPLRAGFLLIEVNLTAGAHFSEINIALLNKSFRSKSSPLIESRLY